MPSDILLDLILNSYKKDKASLEKAIDEAFMRDPDGYHKLLELWSALEVAVQQRSTV